MPTADEILNGLKLITNHYLLYALLWHIIIYLAILAALIGQKPSNRTIVFLVCLPLISVAVFAWLSSNVFTGILFSMIAVFFLASGFYMPKDLMSVSPLPYRLTGVLLLLFGLWYPHFLDVDSFFPYLYQAPTGLIPCPTLSVVLGLALIYNGFNSNALRILLICYGLFYGFFGVFRLGVYLDVVLLSGTIVFLVQFFRKEIQPVKI